MSRHVVLLRRDPSLGLALRALLHGTGKVTELINIQAWSALQADAVDAVVIDLPVPRRKQAVDLIRSRFKGRLVLVLDPIDDPAGVPSHDCSVVQRPFEIVELWHLVTTDPEVPAAPVLSEPVLSEPDPGPIPARAPGPGRAGEGPSTSAVEQQPARRWRSDRPRGGEERPPPRRRERPCRGGGPDLGRPAGTASRPRGSPGSRSGRARRRRSGGSPGSRSRRATRRRSLGNAGSRVRSRFG